MDIRGRRRTNSGKVCVPKKIAFWGAERLRSLLVSFHHLLPYNDPFRPSDSLAGPSVLSTARSLFSTPPMKLFFTLAAAVASAQAYWLMGIGEFASRVEQITMSSFLTQRTLSLLSEWIPSSVLERSPAMSIQVRIQPSSSVVRKWLINPFSVIYSPRRQQLQAHYQYFLLAPKRMHLDPYSSG